MSIAKDATLTAARLGYRVLDDGSVRSPTGHILRTRPSTEGYQIFNVRLDGYEGRKRYTRRVQVAALAAYLKFGDHFLHPGIEVRHLDGNGQNDSPHNIGLGSRSDNEMDRTPEERSERARHASCVRWGKEKARGRLRRFHVDAERR